MERQRRQCKFIPLRNNRIRCDQEILSSAANKHFCKRHSNTTQAKSYSNYDESDKKEGRTRNYKQVQIVQNKFGNFEDKDTAIVFDKVTRKARGYQNHTTGKVDLLTPHHIAICKKNY